MTQRTRLGVVLALNVMMIVGLLIVGAWSRSLGVLAAGGDYAADAVGLLLGIIAVQIAKHPHGHPQATTVVALVNGLVLVTVTGFVIVSGVRRLITTTPEIHARPVVIVSVVAMATMVAAALVLGRDAGREDVHMRSVMLDTIADATAAGGVAVSGAVIAVTHRWYWLDSVVAVAVGLVISATALHLCRDIIGALRHPPPRTNRD